MICLIVLVWPIYLAFIDEIVTQYYRLEDYEIRPLTRYTL
jgi:hypothetical protein